MASRREDFDDLVLDSAERLEPVLRRYRLEVEFAVEDVPPSDPAPWEEQLAPLGRVFPSQGRLPARVVLYRRVVEAQALDRSDLASLVDDVVVEQVADLLGVDPAELDERGG